MQIDVAFQLFHASQRARWPNSEEATDSMSISIAASVLHSGTLATCQRILCQAWEEFGAAYAYADMFASHQTGLVSPWVGPIAARTLRAHLWTSKTESPGIDLRTYVPDAYWLSFLNAQHIQQLGGIEELKAKLPRNATVAPVAYNGYAVTLSQSPLYDNIEDWEADHGALCRVLEPIIRS